MVAIKIRWTPAAEADLLDILEFYYKRNGTIEYSLKLNNNFKSHIQLLKQHPFLGRRTKHKNVRALIAGNYEVLSEYFSDTILIIMIWDCRRNPDDKVIDSRIIFIFKQTNLTQVFFRLVFLIRKRTVVLR